MAVTISTSSSEEDIWMAQNNVFAKFAGLVIARFASDEEIVSQVHLAEAMNGISLDLLYEQNPGLALRVLRAFQSVAIQVADGKFWASGEANDDLKKLFAALSVLLEKFRVEAEKSSTECRNLQN